MLLAETKLRVEIKVGTEGLKINDLVCALFERRDELCGRVVADTLWQVQEEAFEEGAGGV
jgi:hypothetical protein